MADLNICLLGRFEVERNGQLIAAAEWRGQKTRDLLKILLLANGHYVPKDKLYDWLWPEAEPGAAQASLRSVVSDLRKILEPDLTRGRDSAYIVTEHEGYAFNIQSAFQLDTREFERAANKVEATSKELEAALALYRGDLLEEDAYAEWALRDRERLRELRLTTLNKLASLYFDERHYPKSIALGEQAVAIEAAQEGAWRLLMKAQLASGDRAGALATYDRCRAALVRELGVEPSPETLAVYEQALRVEATPRPAPAEAANATGTSSGWLRRLGAICLIVWALLTGLNTAFALTGILQGSFVSPGDPGEVALPYVQAHPEAITQLNQQLYWLFPIGWLLVIGYLGWWALLRDNGRTHALAGVGLVAGIADGLTQTISQAIGLTQLTVLPTAYMTAPIEQQLTLITIWEVLRQLSSVAGGLSLIANPVALLALTWAVRGQPRFPGWLVWVGVGLISASLLYYFVPAGFLGFVIGVGLIFGIRAWLIGVAVVLWQG